MEEDTSEREAVYILLIVRHGADEPWLVCTLHFDRHNLEIIRQKTFDSLGSVLSDTKYSGWKTYDGIPFPSAIDIKRPQDHYEVVLNVLSISMNAEDVTPEKFILNQPPGTELHNYQSMGYAARPGGAASPYLYSKNSKRSAALHRQKNWLQLARRREPS